MQIFISFICKINLHYITFLTVAFFCSSGCAPTPLEVVEEWKSKGWKVVDVHGVEGPTKRHGKLMSKEAKAVEASWVENGKRLTKVYQQDRVQVLVLRFFKDNDDQYAVVMTKKK